MTSHARAQGVAAAALMAVALLLACAATARASGTFASTAPITIPSSGSASPYPSTITVGGQTGAVTDVNVTLANVTHGFGTDVDVLLVSPEGQTTVLMSDACPGLLTDRTLVFDDQAAGTLSDAAVCPSGTFRPSNFGSGDTFGAPAPAGPCGATLSQLNMHKPNGQWRLFVVNDAPGITGSVAGGWSLAITTDGVRVPGSGSSGAAETYPLAMPVSGLTGRTSSVRLTVSGITRTRPDDLGMLLVSPAGRTQLVMSDVCGGTPLADVTFAFDDTSPAALADAGPCTSGGFRPSNVGDADALPAPAGHLGPASVI